jgi:hypothetical protein
MTKIQTIRRSCCNTIFAACCEPYCYTDKDWTKHLKEYVEKGCVVEFVYMGKGVRFEKWMRDKIQGGEQ